MDRRTALKLAFAISAAPLASGCRRDTAEGPAVNDKTPRSTPSRMPAIFLAHGSPLLVDDLGWMSELTAWANAMPRPRSILVLSAHWVDAPVTIGATRTVPLVYDFYGFPRKYYEMRYPAPGAPELAARVRDLVGHAGGAKDEPERGLDHGAYVPLLAMYPHADVPVLQVSIPTMEPATLVALGRALAPLRDEGVLLVGSGFLTHNMRTIDFEGRSPPPSWAQEMDAWSAEMLVKRDVDGLVHYRERAPGVKMALPTHEHFVPVLVTLGASAEAAEKATFPVTGFTYGTFTKRSVQFG
jgi:4,5-DOPA dioxygenase extradiol